MDVSSVLNAALLRGFLLAVLAGVGAAVSAMLAGMDDRTAILTGIGTAVTVLTGRGVLEGGFDANRARTGDVHRSDVGARQGITKTVTTPPADPQ